MSIKLKKIGHKNCISIFHHASHWTSMWTVSKDCSWRSSLFNCCARGRPWFYGNWESTLAKKKIATIFSSVQLKKPSFFSQTTRAAWMTRMCDTTCSMHMATSRETSIYRTYLKIADSWWGHCWGIGEWWMKELFPGSNFFPSCLWPKTLGKQLFSFETLLL